MKVHLFVKPENIETVFSVLDNNLKIGDITEDFTMYTERYEHVTPLINITLSYHDYCVLSDSEKISIK